jgi:hypothetical protein
MLYDPARHEPLQELQWDDGAAALMIARIVRDTEARFSPDHHWPIHPLDADDGRMDPAFNLYFGASGVIWALRYLQAAGAVRPTRSYDEHVDALLPRNRAWLASEGAADRDAASLLMGDTGILLLSQWLQPTADKAARLESRIAGNLDHPTRELMWGAPGTMLAALHLHRSTDEPRWAALYAATARRLWSQLQWSAEHQCHYWIQELYGEASTYLDAVHGFVATAAPLIAGRDLLGAREWAAWEQCIVNTVRRTASRQGGLFNWRPELDSPGGNARPQKMLMQFCHGAPGFVICLADLPATDLDGDLVAGGEAIWQAGPLAKGSNLCHGTGGNGYAFLKLHARTGDPRWLARARAFAMHGIAQTQAHAERYGRMRYSLWTGDLGFAIYLRDCIRGHGTFPTLDAFFPEAA